MARKVRWYSVKLPPGALGALADRMASDSYREQRGWGFVLTTAKRTEVAGTYFERLEHAESVLDPFGRERPVSWIEYRKCEFRISSTFPQLEIVAARSARSLFDRISEYVGDAASFAAVEADVQSWLREIEGREGRVQVTELRGTDVSLSAHTFATVLLSGARDVRGDLVSFIGKRDVKVNRVKFEWPRSDKTCELRADGSASLEEGMTADALAVIREALIAASASQSAATRTA